MYKRQLLNLRGYGAAGTVWYYGLWYVLIPIVVYWLGVRRVRREGELLERDRRMVVQMCIRDRAKMAVEETGMGVVEDKVIKNNYAAEYIYNAYKNTKTVGVIEEDKEYGIKKVAEPCLLYTSYINCTS